MVIDVNVLTSGWAIAGVIVSFFVAIGTITLATVAFKTIQQTKKAFKNGQKNEIISWANDVIQWDDNSDYKADIYLLGIQNIQMQLMSIYLNYYRLGTHYQSLRNRGQYKILPIVLLIKNKSLINKTSKLIKYLKKHIELIRKKQQLINAKTNILPPGIIDGENEISKHKKKLIKCSEDVIREVNNIKI